MTLTIRVDNLLTPLRGVVQDKLSPPNWRLSPRFTSHPSGGSARCTSQRVCHAFVRGGSTAAGLFRSGTPAPVVSRENGGELMARRHRHTAP